MTTQGIKVTRLDGRPPQMGTGGRKHRLRRRAQEQALARGQARADLLASSPRLRSAIALKMRTRRISRQMCRTVTQASEAFRRWVKLHADELAWLWAAMPKLDLSLLRLASLPVAMPSASVEAAGPT